MPTPPTEGTLHECTVCRKAFAQRSHLQGHLLTHRLSSRYTMVETRESRTKAFDRRVEDLYCPFTWGMCIPAPRPAEASIADELPGAPTPWHALVDNLLLAYGYHAHYQKPRGRDFLVRAYMYLLPERVFKPAGCDMIATYREGLRHVLDSCWACMTANRDDPDWPGPLISAFVANITPFSRLSRKQQAALHAIQVRINKAPGASGIQDVGLMNTSGGASRMRRLCVAMSPNEGEWKYQLATEGLYGDVNKAEKMKLLTEAYRLRKAPHTTLALATELLDNKMKAEAAALVAEAQRCWPDHPYVLREAAFLRHGLGGKTAEAFAEANGMLRRAQAIVGNRAAYLYNDLGQLYEEQKKHKEAGEFRQQARALNPIAGQLWMMM